MPLLHLTPEQVTAFRDRESDDPELASHVSACAECRARLREARILGLLLKPPLLEMAFRATATPHLDAEVLAAYFDGTLSRSRIQEVEGHLAGCPDCFAELHDLHRIARVGEAVGEVSPARIAAAIQAFHPMQVIKMGKLLIKLVEDQLGLRLNLIPWPERGQPEVIQNARSDSYGLDGLRFATAAASRVAEYRSEAYSYAGRPVDVPVGALILQINAIQGSTGPILDVRVLHLPDRSPASGMELSLQPVQLEIPLRPDEVTTHSATTGSDGRVQFVIPRGTSTLFLRRPVQAELAIEF